MSQADELFCCLNSSHSVYQESLFGRSLTPAERLRQHQRSLTKAQRELDRERTKLEQQEKKLVMDIKKSAKAGQMVRSFVSGFPIVSQGRNSNVRLVGGSQNACRVMAKDLVRTRNYIQKFYQMRTQLQAVSLRIQTLRSSQHMAEAMRGATRVSWRRLIALRRGMTLPPILHQAMASMNRGLNLPQIQRIMNEFEKESATMDMKEEMMSDAVDDVMDDEAQDEEEEGDKILKEVLDEIGIGLSQEVRMLPRTVNAAQILSLQISSKIRR